MVVGPEDEPSVEEMRQKIVNYTIDTEVLGATEVPDLEAKVGRMHPSMVVTLYHSIMNLWDSVRR